MAFERLKQLGRKTAASVLLALSLGYLTNKEALATQFSALNDEKIWGPKQSLVTYGQPTLIVDGEIVEALTNSSGHLVYPISKKDKKCQILEKMITLPKPGRVHVEQGNPMRGKFISYDIDHSKIPLFLKGADQAFYENGFSAVTSNNIWYSFNLEELVKPLATERLASGNLNSSMNTDECLPTNKSNYFFAASAFDSKNSVRRVDWPLAIAISGGLSVSLLALGLFASGKKIGGNNLDNESKDKTSLEPPKKYTKLTGNQRSQLKHYIRGLPLGYYLPPSLVKKFTRREVNLAGKNRLAMNVKDSPTYEGHYISEEERNRGEIVKAIVVFDELRQRYMKVNENGKIWGGIKAKYAKQVVESSTGPKMIYRVQKDRLTGRERPIDLVRALG